MCGVWCVVCGVWCGWCWRGVCGWCWRVVCVWCLVCGWCVVCGVWVVLVVGVFDLGAVGVPEVLHVHAGAVNVPTQNAHASAIIQDS